MTKEVVWRGWMTSLLCLKRIVSRILSGVGAYIVDERRTETADRYNTRPPSRENLVILLVPQTAADTYGECFCASGCLLLFPVVLINSLFLCS